VVVTAVCVLVETYVVVLVVVTSTDVTTSVCDLVEYPVEDFVRVRTTVVLGRGLTSLRQAAGKIYALYFRCRYLEVLTRRGAM